MDTQGKNDKQGQSVWKKYFSGKNFLINALIAIIPASIVCGILSVVGLRGALVTIGVVYGSIYLTGRIREKVSDRKHKKQIPEVLENKNEIPKVLQSIEQKQPEAMDKIRADEDKSKLGTEQKQPEAMDKSQNKSTKKDRVWVGIILIILVFLTILVTYLFINKGRNIYISPLRTEKSSNYSEQVGNLYRNIKYHFRIKFPEGWKIEEGDGIHVVQKASFGKSTISIIVFQFDFGGEEGFSSVKEVLTLKEFVDTAFEGISEKFSDVKVINYGETKIDNEPAYWIEFSASSQILDYKLNMTGLVYYLAKGDTIYSINAGTATDDYSKIKPLFLQSVSTFVLEN